MCAFGTNRKVEKKKKTSNLNFLKISFRFHLVLSSCSPFPSPFVCVCVCVFYSFNNLIQIRYVFVRSPFPLHPNFFHPYNTYQILLFFRSVWENINTKFFFNFSWTSVPIFCRFGATSVDSFRFDCIAIAFATDCHHVVDSYNEMRFCKKIPHSINRMRATVLWSSGAQCHNLYALEIVKVVRSWLYRLRECDVCTVHSLRNDVQNRE